jgi:hypothetical protein
MIGISPLNYYFYKLQNHYILNVIEIYNLISKAYLPLSYVVLGAKLAVPNAITKDLMVNWKHIMSCLILRFIVIPLFGYFLVFILLNGMQSQLNYDPVLRFAVFITWNIPSALSNIVITTLANHFYRETGLIYNWQYRIIIITISVFLVVYFLLFGTD